MEISRFSLLQPNSKKLKILFFLEVAEHVEPSAGEKPGEGLAE
jgi:hypothetical protein